MSSEATPITPHQFAEAIEDLPVENLYAKAHEINNSIAHLQQSNKVLQEYSDSIKDDTSLDPAVRGEGDRDCLDAIRENEVVIERQRERVSLLKAEVERRGQRWHEADPDVKEDGEGEQRKERVNGAAAHDEQSSGDGDQATTAQAEPQVSGRLTDEELRRQVESLYPQDGADDEGGMHL